MPDLKWKLHRKGDFLEFSPVHCKYLKFIINMVNIFSLHFLHGNIFEIRIYFQREKNIFVYSNENPVIGILVGNFNISQILFFYFLIWNKIIENLWNTV